MTVRKFFDMWGSYLDYYLVTIMMNDKIIFEDKFIKLVKREDLMSKEVHRFYTGSCSVDIDVKGEIK